MGLRGNGDGHLTLGGKPADNPSTVFLSLLVEIRKPFRPRPAERKRRKAERKLLEKNSQIIRLLNDQEKKAPSPRRDDNKRIGNGEF